MKTKIELTPYEKPEMTIEQTIFECGRLGYPIDRIISLLRPRITPEEKAQLIIDFITPGSDVAQTYDSGRAQGEFETLSGLKAAADGGDSDAVEALEKIRRENDVEKAIKESFG